MSGSPSPDPASEPAPILHLKFAVIASIVTALTTLAFLCAFGIFKGKVGLSVDEWNALEAPAKFAAKVTIPIVGLGIVLLLVGSCMAVVEWAGRFAPKKIDTNAGVRTFDAAKAAEVIAAVGKLRGAALVMVVGALLMLSAAWVAQRAVDPVPTPTPQASPNPQDP